jgi:hypothetical protein
MTDTENQPPADMETKSTVGSGISQPGTPGYQIEGQPQPEHGPDGIQYGYSNSPGREGDDGTSSIFTERDKAADSGGSGSKSTTRKAAPKSGAAASKGSGES